MGTGASGYGQETAAIISQASYHRPELLTQLVRKKGFEGANRFFNVFKGPGSSIAGQGLMLGQATAVVTRTVKHVEDNPLFPTMTIGGSASAAGSAGVKGNTITLKSTSHDSNGRSPLRNNDVYRLNKDGNFYKVTDVSRTSNADTFKLTPLLASVTVPAVADGDTMILMYSPYDEGSGAHTSFKREMTEITSKLGIIKERYDATLSAYATSDPIEYPGAFGIPSGKYKVILDESDALMRHYAAMDKYLLWGPEFDNTTNITDIGQTTKGYVPRIKGDGGYNPTYTSGSLALSNFKTWAAYTKQKKAPRHYKIMPGHTLNAEITELLDTYFAQSTGGVNYAAYGGSKDIALALGVNSFSAYGVQWDFCEYSEFDDENTLGTDSDFSKSAFMIPMDKVKVNGSELYQNADPNPGSMVYPLEILYLKRGNEDRFIKATKVGTENGTALGTEDDITGFNYLSEIGLRVRNVTWHGFIEPTTA